MAPRRVQPVLPREPAAQASPANGKRKPDAVRRLTQMAGGHMPFAQIDQRRFDFGANIDRHRATWVETTAFRGIKWTGHIPFQDNSLAPKFGIGYWNRRHQRLRVGMLRIAIELNS